MRGPAVFTERDRVPGSRLVEGRGIRPRSGALLNASTDKQATAIAGHEGALCRCCFFHPGYRVRCISGQDDSTTPKHRRVFSPTPGRTDRTRSLRLKSDLETAGFHVWQDGNPSRGCPWTKEVRRRSVVVRHSGHYFTPSPINPSTAGAEQLIALDGAKAVIPVLSHQVSGLPFISIVETGANTPGSVRNYWKISRRRS